MKGDILLKILMNIGNGVSELSDLFSAFLEAGYGASYGRIQYLSETRRNGGETGFNNKEAEIRHRYSQLIYQLKKDGLIAESKEKSGSFSLTGRGKEKIKKLKGIKKYLLPKRHYYVEKAGVFTIITFDIPEPEKRKREWLREVLRNLGFSFVQKSVWVGKIKLPQDFLEDLKKLHLIAFVEIFQITKTGSLKHLI
ncbi:CRISPR-associated endonuclease Cas2 [bacterium]|nr:MAG: CRISPR-associated endonuclease Cas2 [bacterium]